MFRANKLKNLLYSETISNVSSKIEQVPHCTKGIVEKYGHKIKKCLEFAASPGGGMLLGAAIIYPTTCIAFFIGPNPSDYCVKNVYPYLGASYLTGITFFFHGVKKGLF